tara:strand:- start:176 stop:430 length:255 start_codon:yes stop_codon:yes gene_type:complete
LNQKEIGVKIKKNKIPKINGFTILEIIIPNLNHKKFRRLSNNGFIKVIIKKIIERSRKNIEKLILVLVKKNKYNDKTKKIMLKV